MVRWRRRAVLCVVASAVLVAAGCGSEKPSSAIHVDEGETRLASLLEEHGVVLGSSPASVRSLRAAWAAFKEFAAVPVQRGELSDESHSDGLLFEWGVFDFGGKWGKTFQLSFVRQLAADGDLQQVHLVAHFTPSAFDAVMDGIEVTRCVDGRSCPARCFFADDALLGAPCVLARATGQPIPSSGPLPASGLVWSFDTGGSGTEAQRTSWTAFVENSPVFLEAARKLEPLGYEVWQESAE